MRAPDASILPRLVRERLAWLAEEPVWLVGGAVRDYFLERGTLDLDFAVAGEARRLARRVADRLGARYYDLDPERDTGRVVLLDDRRRYLDFASLRAPTLEKDLRARDFTINAMAVPLGEPGCLIDPTHGLQDLKDRRLRACSPSAVADDPVRALRAVRFAADLRLQIEPGTLRQVRGAASLLAEVSAERLRDEWFRVLGLPRPAEPLRVLQHLGLLAPVCPELPPLVGLPLPPPHAFDAWNHTLAVVEHLARLFSVLGPEHDPEGAAELVLAQVTLRLGRFRQPLTRHLESELSAGRTVRQLLLFAALYHKAGLPEGHSAVAERSAALVRQRARALRLSNEEAERLETVVRYQARPLAAEPALSARWVHRYFRETGSAGVDLALFSLAEFLGTYVPPVNQDAWELRVEATRRLLGAYFEAYDQIVSPPPLVRGDDLMASLGLAPGPTIGQLLDLIAEAQAAGEVFTAEQALDLARRALARGNGREGGEAD